MNNFDDKISYSKDAVLHESAGGYVFYKSQDKGLLVALLKKEGEGYFIPKGHLKNNEIPEKAALREIKEELSIEEDLILLDKLGTQEYSFEKPNDKQVHHKIVHLYIYKIDHPAEIQPEEGDSYETAEWLPVDEAYNLITFDKEGLQKAIQIFNKF